MVGSKVIFILYRESVEQKKEKYSQAKTKEILEEELMILYPTRRKRLEISQRAEWVRSCNQRRDAGQQESWEEPKVRRSVLRWCPVGHTHESWESQGDTAYQPQSELRTHIVMRRRKAVILVLTGKNILTDFYFYISLWYKVEWWSRLHPSIQSTKKRGEKAKKRSSHGTPKPLFCYKRKWMTMRREY